MPLLTVRLSDEDYAALKELAGKSSMAEVVRSWIAGPKLDQTFRDLDLIDAEDRIRVLEGEVRQLKKALAARPAASLEPFTTEPNTPERLVEMGDRTVAAVAEFNSRPFRPAPKPSKRAK